ncbi:MAG TPA: hypothetical protein VMU69_06445 [Bradyrhizobium sp.]|nr:hypothetical protein [Bradyrhizobium sp.]
MPRSMIILPEWLAEAGVQNFKPSQPGFQCDDPDHRLFALADIEPPLRFAGYPLSANGFDHDRMVKLLIGVRDNVALPHILIEVAEAATDLIACIRACTAIMHPSRSAFPTCQPN